MSEMLKNLKAYLKSDAGKVSIEKITKHIEFENYVFTPKWVGKIKEKIDLHSADYVIEKLLNKYRTDEYRDREYKCGVEPRETLLYYLLYYAREHCVESQDDKHYGMFTAEAYFIGSYLIQLLVGQGSFISLQKLKDLKYD